MNTIDTKNMPLPQLLQDSEKRFNDNPLFRSGGFYPFKHDVKDFVRSELEKAYKECIGEIGAKLLAKHSPQVVLDAYFDAANEIYETDN